MNGLRQVQLNIAWRSWSKDHIFTEMPLGQATELVRSGVARWHEPVIAAAAVTSPVEDPPVADETTGDTPPTPTTETANMRSPIDRMLRSGKGKNRTR